jgi:hypothetical protein
VVEPVEHELAQKGGWAHPSFFSQPAKLLLPLEGDADAVDL